MNFFIKLLLFTFFTFSFFNCEAKQKLFNKNEVKTKGIKDFPKWVDVLQKQNSENSVFSNKCKNNKKKFYCNIRELREYLDSIKSESKEDILKAVNSHLNEKKYILDIDNWSVEDYWASTGEFLFKNGDCEDYAISKYMSLKYLGFSDEDMRILILFDNNLQLYHSVLAVYLEGEIFILDNQIKGVIKDKSIYHYTPVFSLNKNSWWRYM